jgi:ABC-type antimicrobial peptide transport system permease subunit
VVTPGYFRALKIPLKRGRYFSETDSLTGERVAVIDENLARQYWPGEDPVGKRIGRTSWYRVVGIVGHVTNSSLAADSGKGMYYVSMLQRPTADAVRYVDPRQSVHSIRSLEDLVSESLAPRRFGMRLLGFFGAIALFLAALGLYGVVSYSVTRRRREIGIRLALGAEHREVMALVLGQGMRLVGTGAVIGIIGSIAGARWMQSQLFEVSPFDPLTILGMGTVLLLAAMLASYLPARRAMRVDPVIALRPE